MRKSILFQLSVLIVVLCSVHISTSHSMPTLYEISTRPWLYSLSEQYGKKITLSNIPAEEFQKLADMKVTRVWMMGVWTLGGYSLCRGTDIGLRKTYGGVLPDYQFDDIIGSPFAVVSYTCNSDIGTDDDIAMLKKKLNSMGIKLYLDFVPNHSAYDCPTVSSNPDYYTHITKGSPMPYDPTNYFPDGIAYGKDPYYPGWDDTAQINYWNPDARQEMLNNLLKIASLSDGVRCDMAPLLLNDMIERVWGDALRSYNYHKPSSEFWVDAIKAVKDKYANFEFMGEAYWNTESTLQSFGFDFTYDKTPYDNLGSGKLDDLRTFLKSKSFSYLQSSAHFVENHDEPRAVDFFKSPQRADAAALVLFTIPGLRLNFMGQWKGYKNPLEIHLRRAKTENPDSSVVDFYNTFLPILGEDVFHSGTWQYLDFINQDGTLLAWTWELNDVKRLCVINYGKNRAGGSLLVPNAAARSGNDTIPVTDLITGTKWYRSAEEMKTVGFTAIVGEWWAQIFSY